MHKCFGAGWKSVPKSGQFIETPAVPVIPKQTNLLLFLLLVAASESTSRTRRSFSAHVPPLKPKHFSCTQEYVCLDREGHTSSGLELRLPVPATEGPLERKRVGIYKLCSLHKPFSLPENEDNPSSSMEARKMT